MPGDRRPPAVTGTPRSAEITRYFLRQHSSPAPASLLSSPSKMAPPRVLLQGAPAGSKRQAARVGEPSSPSPRSSSPILTPEMPHAEAHRSSTGLQARETQQEGDIRDLLADLPTRQDIQAMAASIVAALSKELHEIKQKVEGVEVRVTTLESSHSAVDARLEALEASQASYHQHLIDLQLKIDDGENRNRRNNLRLRGIPEATVGGDLRTTVTAILNQLLEKEPTAALELDRVHRVQGPRMAAATSPLLPRDVLCRVHFFGIKEEILRKAWVHGPIDFDGATVRVYPDISRQTRTMRGILRPLLEVIRDAGATYRWGHPFHLIVLRHGTSFYLHSPSQLPHLFRFLERPAVQVANWLESMLKSVPAGPVPPRPQRSRRVRSRPSSNEPPSRRSPTAPED